MDSPCEFCQSRMISEPCIKLRGPKTEQRSIYFISTSRALTKYDASVPAEDVRVLQLALADELPWERRGYSEVDLFFRNAASVFGPCINHIALRHAILAYFTAYYDVGDPLRHLRHANFACSALRRKLNDPTTLDEGDLFVSFILAQWGAANEDSVVLRSNMLGFTLIMKQLSDRAGGNISSYQLAVFWPLARDYLQVSLFDNNF